MLIRNAVFKDIAELIKMRWDFSFESKKEELSIYNDFFEECRVFFEEIIEGDKWHIWVAEDEGKLVSHIFLQVIDTIPRPGRKKLPFGYITNVYTIPDYRNKGIGGMIIEDVNKWAQNNNMELLIVWPSDKSINFYDRHEFKPSKEILERHLNPFE
ncbi:Acetyltransferase (GNAT) domain-containing protein [Paenibacillus sp. 1_12]|uniref:GNAT family N-acetyltransferase n=1 Tax=Paenibacillus sp. 1_12 TaxID=1566278 RepID=UPI0008E62BC6|nr:GNAT family N-acetyltransferase [Paenibacillus sp. 1_12]SFM36202.1 Acetyltransferase (GNAT) domain-containing protein [Paenibacillus sp. 1_12]